MKNSVEITDQSFVSEARRLAQRLAEAQRLPAECCDRVAIVVTEAATNLLRHAGGGRILLQAHPRAEPSAPGWLEIAAIDRGPGIANLEEAMIDGVSTLGSAGGGLGAMQRLSDRFDIQSVPGEGTVVTCGFGTTGGVVAGVQIAGFLVNCPGENVSGDAWLLRARGGLAEILVIDGLGHGPRAAAAAEEATTAFKDLRAAEADVLLGEMTKRLAGTRGSVGTLVQMEAADSCFSHAGIGNITALVARPGVPARRLIARDGRIGGPARSTPVERVELQRPDTLILHSDGIATIRGIDRMSELLRHSPATIAATLMRDYNRGRDDACVVVARIVPKEE